MPELKKKTVRQKIWNHAYPRLVFQLFVTQHIHGGELSGMIFPWCVLAFLRQENISVE